MLCDVPGAGLVDVDDELIAQLAAEHLVGRGDDRVGDAAIEPLEVAIGFGGGALDEDRRADEAVRRGQAADREVRARARRLHAVVRVGGNAELAERIALDAEGHTSIAQFADGS